MINIYLAIRTNKKVKRKNYKTNQVIYSLRKLLPLYNIRGKGSIDFLSRGSKKSELKSLLGSEGMDFRD